MTILWYDLETWGLKPAWYPPAQFAAIRTDLDFNQVGEPIMFYAKPPNDMLPEPGAVLTTGITPQTALEQGVSEAEFAQQVFKLFSEPGTITSGYNTLRFDDEVMRYSFYRSLIDPYVRESWKNDLGRWDVLDLVRACRALRPDGIEWPLVEGEPSNRLEQITNANNIEHAGAHDALVDVQATISLARLIKQKQPKLYDFAWQLHEKSFAEDIIKGALASGKPVIHTSGKLPNTTLNTSLMYIFAQRGDRRNEYLAYDLRQDPRELVDLSDSQIRERLFTRSEDLNGAERVPVKAIHVGKSPFVAPAELIDEGASERIQLNVETAQKHRDMLIEHPDFLARVQTVFEAREFEPKTDIDAQLYDGFPSPNDRKTMESLISLPPTEWPQLQFDDPKYLRLAKRYVARNFPEAMNEEDRTRWEQFRAEKLLQTDAEWQTYSSYSQELQQLAAEYHDDPGKICLLEELHLYAEAIYPEVEDS